MAKLPSPRIIIGGAVAQFKKAFSGPIRTVSSVDGVRELVAYYGTIQKLGYPLVIEDLSFLSDTALIALLKFVEETPLDITLLSVYDKVPPMLLSRARAVVKLPLEPCTSEFLSVGKGFARYKELTQQNQSEMDRVKLLAKTSPLLYYLETQGVHFGQHSKIPDLLD